MAHHAKDPVKLQMDPDHFIDNWVDFFWSKNLTDNNFADIEFKCKDGSVKAHSHLIRRSCPLIGRVLNEEMWCQSEHFVIVVEDFETETVSKFLQIIYTGKTKVSNPEQFEEIKEFGFKQLGFFMVINWNIFVDTEETKAKITGKEDSMVSATSRFPIHSITKTESIQENEMLNDPLYLTKNHECNFSKLPESPSDLLNTIYNDIGANHLNLNSTLKVEGYLTNSDSKLPTITVEQEKSSSTQRTVTA